MSTQHIRSYAARRGRRSALARQRMTTFLPERAIPPGPLFPQEAFGRVAPVVLEIGCGHGAAAVAYARAHPGHDLLAVDVHTPGLARMMAVAEQAGLRNLWVWQGDAVLLLEDRVPPKSLHAVHLFFPDPWPKARHMKRRFVTAYTLGLLADRLVTGGQLLIATDQDAYAEHVLDELAANAGFDVTVGERPPWRPADGFEAKGLRAGRTVTEVRAAPRR